MCDTHNQDFVHLHLHTEFSLLDGFARIDKVVDYAKSLGMSSLAITDHGTMFGVVDFFRACKKAEIKPIIVVESYLARRTRFDRDPQQDSSPYHMLLLAQNETGYKNLLRLSSEAQLNGYYYRPRIDRELMAAHAEGVIATSGCLAAEIPRMVELGKDQEARELIGWYQDVFGKDNFFLELQAHDIPELQVLNKWLLENAKYANVPLVATNDVHYVRLEDYDVHDTLLCIQTSSLKNDPKRMRMTDNSYHLRTQQEMWKLFGDAAPDALLNTCLIAEMCNVNLEHEGYHLPVFPCPPQFAEAGDYLRYLCEQGVYWRYGDNPGDEVWQRLDHELNIIHTMGFDTYFLIVWDLCEFARHADIWWNVRGSGAGSIVAYTLGITSLDPLENQLLFERFLNPGRVSMPDFDIDFPEDRRYEMIEYCTRKYGQDKVAAIITFGTLGAKAAIRDVGRALEVPLADVDRIARTIPTVPKLPKIPELLGDDPEKAIPDLKEVYNKDPLAKTIIDIAAGIEGVPRHASTHAAGVIVADKPLVEYIPLHRPTRGDAEDSPVKMVTQFPMETAESIGLLKIDFLGLSTLTIMRKACELIEQYHGIRYDMSNIPYKPDPNDPEVSRKVAAMFEMIGRGETLGVFQVESPGMRQMLTEMKPKTFEHIIAAISLYRPGPMDYIPTFNARLHGHEKVNYHHPKLEPILSNTYGICIAGDSVIYDIITGKRLRVDEIMQHEGALMVQGIDENYAPTTARVTDLIYNGKKPVYRITLRNGASIKATADHKFLTEEGWKELQNIAVSDHVSTPPYLVEPEQPQAVDRDKLRVLAYLIADGSLASCAAVDFVNTEPCVIEEYARAVELFDVHVNYLTQIRGVTRVMSRNRNGKATSRLLGWMRELGLKHPAGLTPGGCRSHEKFIPKFVFQLSNDDIAFFLASLWDCDGYIGRKLCHYKTVSQQLAIDVQTLLLRLHIPSVIYRAEYKTNGGGVERTSYQITIYNTVRLLEYLKPYMISAKKERIVTGHSDTTIPRRSFWDEVNLVTDNMSKRGLMAKYGISAQHFRPRRENVRISARVVRSLAKQVDLPKTAPLLNVAWEEVVSIEPAGIEDVYDLTVEGIHNFVANGIIAHNCVYQEQIMQIGAELFGYTLAEADLMRRAVSKKKEKDLLKHRQIFLERGPEHGVDAESAGKIFDDIEFFARYGFNRSHAADYAIMTCQTGYLKCHYPHEYMAALMSVYHDDTPRVTQFITDCRRMGIDVLPPDVNYSFKDYSIEEWQDGSRHVRYGLSSIKNLGMGAIEFMLNCRQDQPFRDLDDFLKRCDMREFGKRALESLIRVGAMDQFGDRAHLLANLDKIMGFSAEHHKNAAIGQVSMFDLMGGSSKGSNGAGSVLSAMTDVPPQSWDTRERLRWEKDLLGLYISDHPLNAIWVTVSHIITHTTADLHQDGENLRGTEIRIAGLVTGIRSITTKAGDSMAILTMEDIHGIVECVMFPRTWKDYREIIEKDKVYVFFGKADMRGTDPNVIVDKVTQDFSISIAEDEPRREQQRNFLSQMRSAGNDLDLDDEPEAEMDEETGEVIKDDQPEPEPVKEPVVAPASAGSTVNTNRLEPQIAAPPVETPAQSSNTLEEPEDFRMAFNQNLQEAPPDTEYAGEYADDWYEPVKQRKQVKPDEVPPLKSAKSTDNGSLIDDRTGRVKPPAAPAAKPRTNGGNGKVHSTRKRTLVVEMERTGDSMVDRRRLAKLHGTVAQYPGDDEFCILIPQRDRDPVRLEFPLLRIKIHEELLVELDKWGWVGVEVKDS